MKKINYLLLMLAVILGFGLTACNDDDNNNNNGSSYTAFVTLAVCNDNGATFTTTLGDDTKPVAYTTNMRLTGERYKVGQRYIIQFTIDTPVAMGGAINLLNVYDIFNGDVKSASAAEIKELTTDPIDINMVQRDGDFLNIQATAYAGRDPKTFALYVDEATIDNEMPDVYVGYQIKNGASNAYVLYGSFGISSLWSKPGCKGLNFHYRQNDEDQILKIEKK